MSDDREAEKANSGTTPCPFCETLKMVRETEEYHQSASKRHHNSRLEYKAALVTERYSDAVDWCTSTVSYQPKALNFCPVCGVKIAKENGNE